MIHIYCGNGKGKTTAAIGLAIRAAGNNMNVLFYRFLKNDHSSELNILKQISTIQVIPCKKDFGFYSKMTEEIKKEARKWYNYLLDTIIQDIDLSNYQMLVLDEIIIASHYQLVDEIKLLTFLKTEQNNLEIILTGRNPSASLLDVADYISCIENKKHPYEKGVPARKGIEF